jgi:hypothetical protein
MTDLPPDEAARKRRRHRNERIVAVIGVVILVAIVAGIIRWSRSLDEELRRNRTYIPGVTEVTPEILLLQEYVRIDTSTPEGSAQGARWIAAYLRKHGIEPEVIASAPDRLNVYARIRGRERGEGLLLFNHIDVMPAGDGWTQPPFAGNIALNQLWRWRSASCWHSSRSRAAANLRHTISFFSLPRTKRPAVTSACAGSSRIVPTSSPT